MKVELADGDFYIVDLESADAADGQGSLGAAVIFDGAHGWHNTYRLIDLATEHGMKLTDEDGTAVSRYRADPGDDDCETVHDLAGKAEDYLNDQLTTEGWAFGWSGGEFLLANEAWWRQDV